MGSDEFGKWKGGKGMSEWKKVKLGDLYTVHNGLSKSKEFFGSGYPFLTFSNVFNNWFLPDKLEALVQSTDKDRESFSIQRGDIFITRTSETMDELGMSSVALKDYPNATFNGFTKRLRPKNDDVLPEYIGYYLRSKKFRNKFLAFSSMTTRASLANSDLLDMEVEVPEKNVQRNIANILSRYDSLIENYQKQIKLLEESAQRLYKDWFVDLRFPGYENTKFVDGVPEGWEKKCLGDFCFIFTGKKNASSGIKNGKYKFFTCGDKPLSINSYIYDGAAIIISGNGSYTGRTTFFKGKFDLYQRTYACAIKPGFNNNYIYGLYEFVNSELTSKISGGTHGAAVPYIVMSDLTEFTFLYNEYVLLKFSSIIKKNLLETIKLIDRIQLLTEARDRLLPKLMSGEIEV